MRAAERTLRRMTTPAAHERPDPRPRGPLPAESGRRTGATWIAATGAALLLAAASIFVAVRWDHLGDLVKFTILAVFTALCFNGGLVLRRTLPASGSVLVHLGALLVPVNLAAANLRLGLSWRELLLLEGVLGLLVFAGTARLVGSVVLGAAASGAVLTVCAGVAALTPVPAPLLAALAAGAMLGNRRAERHAAAWACAAAVAPLVALVFNALSSDGGPAVTGRGVVADLGVLDVAAAWSGITAATVALVIAVAARRFDRLALTTFAACGAVAHGLAAWSSLNAPGDAGWVALAALFLLVEIAALGVRHDRFWSGVGRRAADIAECGAGLGVALAASVLLDALGGAFGDGVERLFAPDRGVIVASFVLVGVGYLVGEVRRAPAGTTWVRALRAEAQPGFDVLAALPLMAAAVAATDEPAWGAAGALTIGAGWLAVCGTPSATVALAYAVFLGSADGRTAPWIGAGVAIVLVLAAVRARREASDLDGGYAVIGLLSFAAGLLAGVTADDSLVSGVAASTTVWLLGCWAIASALDLGRVPAARFARVAGASSAVWLVVFPPARVWVPATVLAAAAVVEAVRRGEYRLALVGVAPVVQLQIAAAQQADLSVASTGLALGAASFVWLGVAVLLDDRHREPVLAAGIATFAVGFVLACTSAATVGPAFIALGSLSLAAGLLTRQEVAQHAGGAIMSVGVWLLLGNNGVELSEAYVAPIGTHLLVAGAVARARTERGVVSSWLAYGPGVMLLAAPAVLERIGGAGAGHAVFAGLVGGTALVVGGWQRQAGPLLLGTLVLGVVALHETLDTARAVSSWVWLAAGGTALLGVAVAMERTETSRVEAGRRVVDVLAARFD